VTTTIGSLRPIAWQISECALAEYQIELRGDRTRPHTIDDPEMRKEMKINSQ
jgi:hypothetical protein